MVFFYCTNLHLNCYLFICFVKAAYELFWLDACILLYFKFQIENVTPPLIFLELAIFFQFQMGEDLSTTCMYKSSCQSVTKRFTTDTTWQTDHQPIHNHNEDSPLSFKNLNGKPFDIFYLENVGFRKRSENVPGVYFTSCVNFTHINMIFKQPSSNRPLVEFKMGNPGR